MRSRRLGLLALVLFGGMTGLLISALWRSQMPPEPDWQAMLADALAKPDCVGAADVLAAAMDADVPEAFDAYDRLFLSDGSACVRDDVAATDAGAWLVGSLPETREEVSRRAAYATDTRNHWPGPIRRALMLLQGFEPSHHGDGGYEYEAAYPGIGFVTRLKLVWLTLGCDPLMGSYQGPDWHELESTFQPDGQRWLSGAWNDRARACANDVADLIDDIGIGATGPDGDLVADLLIYAPFTTEPRLAYLKAQRALDHKLAHKWSEPDPEGTRLRMQGLVDLYIAARAGHPQAMARIGRVALAGDLAPVMEDMSASDERVTAFVFLSLAQEAGQDTQDDLTAAAAGLNEDERQRADETLEMWRADFVESAVAWAEREVR